MNHGHLDYKSAVLQAKDFIQERRFRNGCDLATPEGYESFLADKVGRLAAYSSLSGFTGHLLFGDLGEFNPQQAQNSWDENVGNLIAAAETDAKYFEALLLGTASELEKESELHPKLRRWVGMYLRGKISAPPKRKGRGESIGLHIVIAHAVADLVESGMKPTRNDEGPALSACDAVADALAELSLSPITFLGVKRIWLRCDKSFWIRLS